MYKVFTFLDSHKSCFYFTVPKWPSEFARCIVFLRRLISYVTAWPSTSCFYVNANWRGFLNYVLICQANGDGPEVIQQKQMFHEFICIYLRFFLSLTWNEEIDRLYKNPRSTVIRHQFLLVRLSRSFWDLTQSNNSVTIKLNI